MARLVALLLITTQFLIVPSYGSGAQSRPDDLTHRALAIAQVEGMVLTLRAILSVDRYEQGTEYSVDDMRRLYDFFDYLEPIQQRLALASRALANDQLASVRLNRMMREIAAVAKEIKDDLKDTDADDHDTIEILKQAKASVSEVLDRFESFLSDFKQQDPESTSVQAIPSSNPAVSSMLEANEKSLTLVKNVTILRAMLIQIDIFTAFENNQYSYQDDDDERYAEYYTMVSYLNTVAQTLEDLGQQLAIEGSALGVLQDGIAELRKITSKADKKYLSNNNVSVDEHDWREHFGSLKSKVQEVRDDLTPLVELYEREASSSFATLDAILAKISEQPELFTEATQAAAAAHSAELGRLADELAEARRATEAAQEARRIAEANRQSADRDNVSAQAALRALDADRQRVEAAIARHDSEVGARTAAIAQINAAVPSLRSLVEEVFGVNSYGDLTPATIRYLNVPRSLQTHPRFLLLQRSLQTRIDALLTAMKQNHLTQFQEALAKVGAPETARDFNLSATLVLMSPERKWYHKISARVALSVTVEAFGVRREIYANEQLQHTLFKISKTTGEYDNEGLVQFINNVLPGEILATLLSANPEVSGVGRMTAIVDEVCKHMLADFQATISPLQNP